MTINLSNFTPYANINNILTAFTTGIESILIRDLIGIYLFGSLTYGDFDINSSDIDLIVVTTKPLSHLEIYAIKQLHESIEEQCPEWK